MSTILESYFAVNVIYPFVLIFTIVFAILQKSKILGDDKKQIDALVALSISLIFVGFSWATGIVSKMIPFLAISLVVLLVFMILFGFVASTNDKGLDLNKNVKVGIGVLAALVTLVALLWASGQWDYVIGLFYGESGTTSLAANVLLIAIIIGALAVILTKSGSSSNGKSKTTE